MEKLLRTMLQSLGTNRKAHRLARKYGLRFGASRFVAGETIAQSLAAVQTLNRQGKMATLDHLGEFVSTQEEANEAAAMCIQTLDAIASSGVQANLSLKLTSLGLDLGYELCLANMLRILERAGQLGLFVRIDMEDYAHCEIALNMYRELRETYANVGVVIQAYLYRSLQDVEDLGKIGANLRLVKGAYKESPQVAFPQKADVDNQFLAMIRRHLDGGHYTAIATHDAAMIAQAKQFIAERRIPNEQFEFQMLYGIAEDLQDRLVEEGYRVRIYVPFGVDWFGYFMRRLAERPANVWFVLKNIVR
ncbi:proline dehydrogenase family protein [Paenibacillus ferrarius]|uniref:proline dehydrogenase family protein n=1 Tax=Paenibacillus ferrarius TaxID=1469647 RepID=UPI003D2812B2